ncbi:MAG: putative zinc-binding protein [Anaerolineales bacterium]|nr:putative zinc-binding protein [Anaerolineales bacterium]
MPELPGKKVGIVACSGEELPEGTVTRLAALKVLEELRPGETVTICLPLFLAGGEGDRTFARFYPTIALDGCELRCAARGTEMYSGKPAASVVVRDLIQQAGLPQPGGRRRLDEAGRRAVEATARETARLVDDLLGRPWSRLTGAPVQLAGGEAESHESIQAACSCGSGIPIQRVLVDEQEVTLMALPLIFENLRQQGKMPGPEVAGELLATVGIYNPIPAGREAAYEQALLREYAAFCQGRELAQ